MDADTAVRAQLIEGREKIKAQLIELEGTGRGQGDCRAVYAELQRELSEINELLGSNDGGASHSGAETAMSDYYPLPSLAAQLRQPKRSIFLIAAGLFGLLWLVFAPCETCLRANSAKLAATAAFHPFLPPGFLTSAATTTVTWLTLDAASEPPKSAP